ncbi:MAG TPA: hypothetical protein DDW52_04690 [Planctomycetaceae bacterium]|nr:hypothetical protein [Planctomycetaceae bacterium]
MLSTTLMPHTAINLADGYDFFTRCKIVEHDAQYMIFCEGNPIEGIASFRRDVIHALIDGASSHLCR